MLPTRSTPQSSRVPNSNCEKGGPARELFELEASIREKRPPRTDVMDGLHDVVLCHAIARSQINNGPVSLPSQLPEWSVQN